MKMLTPRLLPAVAGAAAALLILKAVDSFERPSTLAQVASEGFYKVRTNATGVDPDVTGSTPAPKTDEKKKDDKPAPPPPGTPVNLDAQPVSPAEKALLERLGQRREQLDERQRELEMRENLLKAADKKLESRIQELKELETKSPQGETAAAEQQQQQQGLKNLVTMYETMKPKEAARVFDKLELAVLVPVVNAMNPRKMAEILAAMSPEAASKLTVELANRGQQKAATAQRQAPLPAGELPAIDPKRP
ncbi:MotE family protein [Alsobacter sp. R-9]